VDGIAHVAHGCGGSTSRQFFEKKSCDVFSTSGLRVFVIGAPHWPSRPQPVITLSHSAVVVHARPVEMSIWTFCWSASHVRRFEGADAVADVDVIALAIMAVGGADMPAAEDDAATGSAAMAASIVEGDDSLGFVQADTYDSARGAIAMAAKIASLNRAP
jgi:hypothetical protein